MRLFVAIDLSEAICALLRVLCVGLRGARWSEVNQMHVTLRFIGDVDPQAFDDVTDSLADVDQSEFEMALQGVGHFPSRGQPPVLWAGVTAPPANRRISADLPAKIVDFLEANAMFGAAAFPVDAFHLYASHLTENGGVHTVECSYPLRSSD